MFTGIISLTTKVKKITRHALGRQVVFARPPGWRIKTGESVAVDGVCSTVTKAGRNFEVYYMPETLRRTTVAEWDVGTEVNLERSLRFGDRLAGHFVLGHVDGRGRVLRRVIEGGTPALTIAPDKKELLRYVAPQGAITVSGVNLTVVSANRGSFTVALIPFTRRATTLGALGAGDKVNIEIDTLARLVANLK